ncbi:MAG: NAD-dependent epimerase/dehydratase family protein [Megasphaera sp.]|nr:NAD-dependent epimerase/dehydratase family protein [Megasphaera sp.]MCH4187070.1 NAD-dependent epimerase/dehydratase family protein [Megasphaera sp.]MCH4216994.1 NAD-dependent epimerase/dehydratase family protein [Megasphaera sp.]
MNILVTGGAGFIGSHLTDTLVAEGHNVTVVDNLSTGNRDYVNGEATFCQADIRDGAAMDAVFDQGHFQIVFHEAAQTLVPYSIEHPLEDADLNIIGLLNILERCRRYGVEKILFSSSAAVYGDNLNVPIKEEEPLKPASFYGLTKVTAERYIQLYHDIFGLSYAILRYSNVYGERQGSHGEGGVVYIFSKALAKGKGLTIYGDGDQSRDFVYVKDVVRANIAAMAQTVEPGIYNISTKIETTVNALKEILFYFSNAAVAVRYEAARSGDIYRSALDNRKAVEKLKWRPVTKLMPGLLSTYNYFAEEELH